MSHLPFNLFKIQNRSLLMKTRYNHIIIYLVEIFNDFSNMHQISKISFVYKLRYRLKTTSNY